MRLFGADVACPIVVGLCIARKGGGDGGDAKIGDVGLVLGIKQNVVGVELAVDEAVVVGRVYGRRQLIKNGGNFAQGEGAVALQAQGECARI